MITSATQDDEVWKSVRGRMKKDGEEDVDFSIVSMRDDEIVCRRTSQEYYRKSEQLDDVNRRHLGKMTNVGEEQGSQRERKS